MTDATSEPVFVPHHELVPTDRAGRERWMFVLHGILGSGANWRTFAKRLAGACPGWGFVLVDLRGHGQSTGAPAPHSLVRAARDLVDLERHLGEKHGISVAGVLGHSFGGKVAIAYADLRGAPLDQVWILDAQPRARVDELTSSRTEAVVRMLEDIPEVLPTRERFVEIVEAQGHNRTFAAWLAMNLRRVEPGPDGAQVGYRLRVDMAVIRTLFGSYYTTDLWPALERGTRASSWHMVVGGQSDVLTPGDREGLRALAGRSTHLEVHELAAAGHWVHIDDPEGLFSLVSNALVSTSAV